jgi:Sel1 repeat
MFVPLRYTIFGWTPPKLSAPERIWLGGEIAKVGRAAFVASLKRRLSDPRPSNPNKSFTFAAVLSDAEKLNTHPARSPSAIVVAVLFFGACFAFLVAFPPFLFVLAVSGGSLLWMHRKTERWVQSLIDDYTHAIANEKSDSNSSTTSSGCESGEIRQIRQLAEQGQAAKQFDLGFLYDKGRGVQRNDREAAIWYRRAAEQGYAPAQSNLGSMYLNGRGVESSDREAVVWYRRAAEQGYAPAQSNLGAMYFYGRAVKQNHCEALAWFSKSAEQGYADAQFNLSVMYAHGHGVEKNESAPPKLLGLVSLHAT